MARREKKRNAKKQPPTGQVARRSAQRRRRVATIVVCILLGVLLAVPALFVNDAIGYAPIIAYLVVLLLSFAYVRILRRSLSFEELGVGTECTRGETVNLKLLLKNASILPAIRVQALFYMSDIFGGEGATDIHNITLGPRRERTFEFGIRFDHIGSYEVGIREVRVYDVFGIFSAVYDNDHLTEVNVQPRVFDIDDLPITKDAAVEAKKSFTSVINDGMDYSGVREYRWGDPIKTIHWKLSSRLSAGEYLTRLYETNANPGMTVISDFDAPEYTVDELMGIYDAVVECSFSIERFAAANGFDAEFVFEDKAKRRRRFMAPFAGRHQEVLDRMPQIFSPGTGKDALAIIREEQNSQFGQSNLIVITSVLSQELMESLAAARVGKRVPVLFAIVPATIDDEKRKQIMARLRRLNASGVSYSVLSDAAELAEVSR